MFRLSYAVALVSLALGPVACSACEDMAADIEKGQQYSGAGITFQHSYAWNVQLDDAKTKHKVVHANHGDAHVIIEIFEPKRTADDSGADRARQFTARALEDLKTWRWSDMDFADESSKAVKAAVAGEQRKGERWSVTLEIEMDSDVDIVTDLFAFDHGNRSFLVAAGGRPEKVEEQREEIAQILTTLRID